jgi:hypothetical protein
MGTIGISMAWVGSVAAAHRGFQNPAAANACFSFTFAPFSTTSP